MRITFDPKKRDVTLRERNLDFADAAQAFRFSYPEPRFTTYGELRDRVVVVIWTPTADGCRAISMRKADERERKALGQRLDVR